MSDFITNAELRIEAERLCDENDQLKAENASLRKERNHWHVEQVHAYGNWEDAHKRVIELEAENAKLRDWCSELLHMAESNDSDFLHWPEIHDELRKLGVKIVKL